MPGPLALLAISCIFFFHSIPLSAQNLPQTGTDIEWQGASFDYALRNRISALRVDHYRDSDLQGSTFYTYDSTGIPIRSWTTNAKGRKTTVEVYFFDQHRRMVRKEWENLLLHKKWVYNKRMTYDDAGRVSSTTFDTTLLVRFIYDENNRVASSLMLTLADTAGSRDHTWSQFDAQGRMTDWRIRRYQNSVDTAGIEILHLQFVFDGNTHSRRINLCPSDTTQKDGDTFFDFDDAGHVTAIRTEQGSSVFYTYNAKGLVETHMTIMPARWQYEKTVDRYTYTFRRP